MDVIDTKILVACLFGIVRFIFGILPIKIYKCLKIKDEKEADRAVTAKRHLWIHCGLALFQAFGGGVIFATCFLHMIPEVYESTIDLKKYGIINSHYPFSQLIVSLGFFFVYFIEEFAQWSITRLDDSIVVCEKHKEDTASARTVTPSNKVAPEFTETISVIDDLATPQKVAKELESESEEEDVNLERTKDFEQVEALDSVIENRSITRQHIFRGCLIVLALSLHAFFEGLAIGLQTSTTSIWYLFVAISIHSATTLFSIGLELLLAKAKLRTIVIYVLILSITSPVGVLLGLVITLRTDMETKATSVAIVLLEGLSAGTILYITFFEVLNREKERRVYRLRRAFFIVLGFGLMACLELAEFNTD